MTASWSLGADIMLAVLLISTIVVAVRLERALRVIRRDRGVFEALILNLSSATDSVKVGIEALRDEAGRAARHIGQSSQDADKMATDLSFLIEAADRSGARLEERLRSSCPEAASVPPESKSVRRFRKLREGVRLPQSARGKLGVEPLILTVPVSGPAAAPPPVYASQLGGLFQQAGITTRNRRQGRADATEPVPSEAEAPASSYKKLG